MHRLILFVAIFSFLSLEVFAAVTGISQGEYTVNDIISIDGEGFGAQAGDYSYVCFNTEEKCVLSHTDLLKGWTDNKITFKIPGNIDPAGMAYVYATTEETVCYEQTNYCYTKNTKVDVGAIPYKFKPYVWSLNNEAGFEISGALVAETVVIKGYLFGDPGTVTFGGVDAKIISWNAEEIKVQVPNVKDAAVDIIVKPNLALPSSPQKFNLFKALTNDLYSAYQIYLTLINALEGWELAPKKGAGITVAVIDTGVNLNHPDLRNNLWINTDEIQNDGIDNDNNGYIDDYYGYNFVDDYPDPSALGEHGTLVAGIIAAERENQLGIAGIAPGVKIMPLVVCEAFECDIKAVNEAIIYAANNGAKVINLSISGPGTVNDFTTEYDEAIQYAYSKGLVIVVAAGNGDYYSQISSAKYGRYLNNFPNSPVCNDNGKNMVIGVLSTDDNMKRSNFSDYGSGCIDVAAPGEGIISLSHPVFTGNNLDVNTAWGTSFAAPQVSAAIALLLAEKPYLKNYQIAEALNQSGLEIDIKQDSAYKGHVAKFLDIAKLLKVNLPNLNQEKTAKNAVKDVTKASVFDLPSEKAAFGDVMPANKNYQAINFLKEKGIVNGYNDGTFRPQNDVNRAELLKILIEGQGIKPSLSNYHDCFADVHQEWFAPYVCYAKALGWVSGYGDGKFRPEQAVNKVEALKMLLNSQNVQIPAFVELMPFTDVSKTEWYAPFVLGAYDLGVLEETGARFFPSQAMKRGGIAENLYRLLTLEKF